MAVDRSSSMTGGAVTHMMSKDFSPTAGQMVGVGALISAYGEAEAQKAAAINQQTGFLLQARDTLAVSQVRAEFSEQYATIQAGRTVKKAELEAQNYTIAGNTLLKNMRATNASMRARAAASGVALGSGSIQNVISQNVEAVMRDVNIADLNALTAKVLGFEDASAMLQSTDIQNTLSMYSARSQAGQFDFAGSTARKAGGMLAGATLVKGGVEAYKIMKSD
jgi:hypothetical protein